MVLLLYLIRTLIIKNTILALLILALPGFSVIAADTTSEVLTVGTATSIKFSSKILNQTCSVLVYTPERYDESKKHYPTLYLLDGERHLNHAVLATKLYQELALIPELIIVAINNLKSEDARSKDLYHNRKAFSQFLGGELQSYVSENYRTTNESILYGHSLAAFFTIDLLVTQPDMFDKYIAASPPMQGQVDTIYQGINAANFKSNKTLYLTMAARAEEGEEVFAAYTHFTELLKTASPNKLDWQHEMMADQNHITNYYVSFFKGIAKVFYSD